VSVSNLQMTLNETESKRFAFLNAAMSVSLQADTEYLTLVYISICHGSFYGQRHQVCEIYFFYGIEFHSSLFFYMFNANSIHTIIRMD
jgi:hypothetical protein